MEKINALIQQLCQLHASNASLQTIKPVVQQLHLAVQHETQPITSAYSTQGSVSVWMPTPLVAIADAGGGEVPEPFPQPNPEPFPQPNEEPFPNPVPPAPNPTPEPVPEPTPQPQEPTTLPPAEPTTPTRLSFGVPRPPQQIFEDAVELPITRPEPHTNSYPKAEIAALPENLKDSVTENSSLPKPANQPFEIVEAQRVNEDADSLEPAVIQAVMQPNEPDVEMPAIVEMESKTVDLEEETPAAELSEWFVPPVIDWKMLEVTSRKEEPLYKPLPEHQAWAGMEVEKAKEEATVVSRNVTPKELAIDAKTLTDIDELVRGKKQTIPGKSAELSELNDRLAERTRVLNESFSQHHEMAEMFSGPRIVDLRKAISINEKYQYVNNLFRGDEDMFERSVKTINNFRVMEEADFWVQRELVIKLGWNPDDELAQRFYSLVRRRFS